MIHQHQSKLTQHKQHRYGIRKFKVGIVSVMFASFFFISLAHDAHAAETTQQATAVSDSTHTQVADVTKEKGSVILSSQDHVLTEKDNHSTKREQINSAVQNLATSAGHDDTKSDEAAQSTTASSESSHEPQTTSRATTEAHVGESTTFREAQAPREEAASTEANNTVATEAPAPQANAHQITVKGINEKVYQKTIPVMAHPSTAQTVGMSRGIGQGRESLGFIVPANTKLYIRQSSPHKEGELTVSLVTDNSQLNKNVAIPTNGKWISVRTSIDSGAFVHFPRGFHAPPQVDYYVENNQGRTLPTYRKGDNQANLEKEWHALNSSYIFVEGGYNAFLIPKVDRQIIGKMKTSTNPNEFKTLDQMIDYYDDVIRHYNQWSGLNDDPTSINYNVQQKYFTMADKRGYGLAYWTWDHMGSNQPSIRGYLTPGWLSLHEVGHGFDGWMIGDGRMELVEIWNNIFANEYQTKVLHVKKGWLYQGKQADFQKRVQNKMLSHPSQFSFGSADAREKLDFMTRMVRLTTMNGVTDMLKAMREEAAHGHTNKDVPRWIIEHWLSDHGYNGLSYFDLYQIPLPTNVVDKINSSHHSYIYPLAMLIDNPTERQKYVTKLGLSSIYELVRSSDLKDTTIDSHATVVVRRNGQILPEGSQIKLIDGTETVAMATIQGDTATFEHIRPGIYKIVAPLSKDAALPENAYIVVRENGANQVTLDYPEAHRSQYALTQHIALLGLGNHEFAGIDYNPYTKQVVYQQNKVKPHLYYTDEFAHVTIETQQGERLLDQSLIGNQVSPAKFSLFNLNYGDKIIVKHREAESRRKIFRLENGAEMVLPNKAKQTITYVLTDKGLIVDNETEAAAEKRYDAQIKKDVRELISTFSQDPHLDLRTRLYRVVQSVKQINGPEKEQLMNQLQPYLQETKTLYTPEPTITTTEPDSGIIGHGPANATIQLTFPSGAVVNTTTDETGEWYADAPENEEFHPGDMISAVATEPGKFPSTVVSAPINDTEGPAPVTVNLFKEHATVISGRTEPHTTVEVELPNHQKLTTKTNDGNWSIQLPPGNDFTSQDILKVRGIDNFGNRSIVTYVTPEDVTSPVAPTVEPTEEGKHIVWGRGEEYKNKIEVRMPNGTIIKTKVGRDLTWMIGVPFDINLRAGDQISVTDIDGFGNRSQPGIGEVVDTTPPQPPVVQKLIEGDSSLTGQAEPGTHIIVQLPSQQTLETLVQPDGTWQLNGEEIARLHSSDAVTVVARDNSHNTSRATHVTIEHRYFPASSSETASTQTEVGSEKAPTATDETSPNTEKQTETTPTEVSETNTTSKTPSETENTNSTTETPTDTSEATSTTTESTPNQSSEADVSTPSDSESTVGSQAETSENTAEQPSHTQESTGEPTSISSETIGQPSTETPGTNGPVVIPETNESSEQPINSTEESTPTEKHSELASETPASQVSPENIETAPSESTSITSNQPDNENENQTVPEPSSNTAESNQLPTVESNGQHSSEASSPSETSEEPAVAVIPETAPNLESTTGTANSVQSAEPQTTDGEEKPEVSSEPNNTTGQAPVEDTKATSTETSTTNETQPVTEEHVEATAEPSSNTAESNQTLTVEPNEQHSSEASSPSETSEEPAKAETSETVPSSESTTGEAETTQVMEPQTTEGEKPEVSSEPNNTAGQLPVEDTEAQPATSTETSTTNETQPVSEEHAEATEEPAAAVTPETIPSAENTMEEASSSQLSERQTTQGEKDETPEISSDSTLAPSSEMNNVSENTTIVQQTETTSEPTPNSAVAGQTLTDVSNGQQSIVVAGEAAKNLAMSDTIQVVASSENATGEVATSQVAESQVTVNEKASASDLFVGATSTSQSKRRISQRTNEKPVVLQEVTPVASEVTGLKQKVLPHTGQSESLDWKAILLSFIGFGLLSSRYSKKKKEQ